MSQEPFVSVQRVAYAISASVLVSACTVMNSPADLVPPRPEDFPERELSFSVSGTQNSVRQSIIDLLSENSMFYQVEIRSPQTFIVTVYLSEPHVSNATRKRKTAYRFSISPPSSGKQCVPLAVTWITRSQGMREELWSVLPEDVNYQPDSWQKVKTSIDRHRCAL